LETSQSNPQTYIFYFCPSVCCTNACLTAETNPNEAKAKKKDKKETFKIDFFTPHDKDLKELTKELFAPVGKGQSINLPGTGTAGRKGKKKMAEKKNDHRLPDDMHFSSRQLVKLFLKPKFEVCDILFLKEYN